MSAQVYSVPGQCKGRRKAVLEWKIICLFSKLSLTCEGNVNYYKNVHHPNIPTLANREHPGNFQKKSVGSPFNWIFRFILFLAKLKGRGRPFLKDKTKEAILWDCDQAHLVVIRDENVSPFVKFETILPLFSSLLDPVTNKHCRTWQICM